MNLQTAAEQVADNLNDKSYKFDITVIFIIMEILAEMLPLLQDICDKTPEDIVGACKRPNRLHRIWVSLKLRNALGRQAYRESGKDVAQALFATGAKFSTEEMQDLVDSVYYDN